MMYSGIDLHSNNSVVAVIDDGDRVVAQKRLPNDIVKITGFLARWQDELAGVVVESTYNWYWLVDGLQDAGLHVHLANTAAIKQYEGLKHSGDETDAQHLAHLLRLGILTDGYDPAEGAPSRARPGAQAHAAGAVMHDACAGG
jgi:transposase